ncbi:MAG TPA: PAS domain-containing protein, partial [Spirochaetia bacterium]|nr:PAS domain-containing protein [Spirochaetia bacterium]
MIASQGALSAVKVRPGMSATRASASDEEADTYAILVIDADGTVESCDRRLLAMLGITNGGLAGTSFSSLFPSKKDARSFLKSLQDDLPRAAISTGELSVRRSGGGETVELVYEASALCEAGPGDAVAGRAAGRIALRLAEKHRDGAGEEAR